jgi:hypothetical protein
MTADRDARGLFLPGHSIKSPGRRRVADEERYLSVLRQTVTDADWAAIVGKACEQAKRGDSTARAILAAYMIGKPTEYVNANVNAEGVTLSILLADVRHHLGADEESQAEQEGAENAQPL